MSDLRQQLMWLDDAMEAIELRGEVGPVAELVVAGVAERLAVLDMDPATAAALLDRMRALIHPASEGQPAALDELWTHTRVLRELLACRLARRLLGPELWTHDAA
jgi:hypothetical protein